MLIPAGMKLYEVVTTGIPITKVSMSLVCASVELVHVNILCLILQCSQQSCFCISIRTSVAHVNMVHDMKKNSPQRFCFSQILAACAKQETGRRKPLVGFLDKSFKMVRSDAGEDNSNDF